ncbi:MAG: hypothetical protein ACRCTY_07580, partial [Candidatus Adiutrix sp.]
MSDFNRHNLKNKAPSDDSSLVHELVAPKITHLEQGEAITTAGDSAPKFLKIDGQAVVVLAKEIGRLLSSFPPPDGFSYPSSPPFFLLNDNMKRDLGTSSLDDFYALALRTNQAK